MGEAAGRDFKDRAPDGPAISDAAPLADEHLLQKLEQAVDEDDGDMSEAAGSMLTSIYCPNGVPLHAEEVAAKLKQMLLKNGWNGMDGTTCQKLTWCMRTNRSKPISKTRPCTLQSARS